VAARIENSGSGAPLVVNVYYLVIACRVFVQRRPMKTAAR